MEQQNKPTVYLDQNLLSDLRKGEIKREKLLHLLDKLTEKGARFVYSDVHVEECRAFYAPEQYVEVLNDIDAWYIHPSEQLGTSFKAEAGVAEAKILEKTDFADRSLSFISKQTTLMQFCLGWLGELKAEELKLELQEDIDCWIKEFESETLGLIPSLPMREQLLEALNSLDLNALRDESKVHQPQSVQEWNRRYNQIDSLEAKEVTEFIFRETGEDSMAHLMGMFPKGEWPDGMYQNNGTLAGLAFLLFTQGVGRDRKVKSGKLEKRKTRLQAQFRDCRHIEAAAVCDLFLSNDDGAIQLAGAVYAYSGINTATASYPQD